RKVLSPRGGVEWEGRSVLQARRGGRSGEGHRALLVGLDVVVVHEHIGDGAGVPHAAARDEQTARERGAHHASTTSSARFHSASSASAQARAFSGESRCASALNASAERVHSRASSGNDASSRNCAYIRRKRPPPVPRCSMTWAASRKQRLASGCC